MPAAAARALSCVAACSASARQLPPSAAAPSHASPNITPPLKPAALPPSLSAHRPHLPAAPLCLQLRRSSCVPHADLCVFATCYLQD